MKIASVKHVFLETIKEAANERTKSKMADVYKFKVKLKEVSDKIWRDIEITSVSSVAKLGYAVLAAFESNASHFFNIQFNGKRYEIIFDEDFGLTPAIDPIKTKLSALKLSVGDVLKMEYDYGAGWEFTIELVSITEMKRGFGTHYPYITDGAGKGIIEDTYAYFLADLIKKADTAKISYNNAYNWDYKDFDLEYSNVFFKDKIYKIQCAYEEY